ncbi:MAG: 50S ribosomal protein L29 [Omnitrophica bacterium RIFCSPHIGHO2_02_FULL_51_18]|nr:MAG: 50S ribosomal protein L29 [Omnitrophica bacterium RIFCSPHIGHO2_02_FULL_51_18]
MSRGKVKELRGLSAAELVQKKFALQKELFDLGQKKLVGQLDKPHLFKITRRQIAQVNTLLRETNNA